MKVLIVKPGYAPYEAEINGLHEMQAVVGGLIQAIYPFEDKVAVVCNDEGILLGIRISSRLLESQESPTFLTELHPRAFCFPKGTQNTLLRPAPPKKSCLAASDLSQRIYYQHQPYQIANLPQWLPRHLLF